MDSSSFSFKGWNLWKFIKGRKKMVITLVAGLLGYVITDSGTTAVVSAAAVEAGFALIEYFFKKYD